MSGSIDAGTTVNNIHLSSFLLLEYYLAMLM